jgi:hypothetical protein
MIISMLAKRKMTVLPQNIAIKGKRVFLPRGGIAEPTIIAGGYKKYFLWRVLGTVCPE